jgi:GNAT superfamily N-acetyltransferase
MNLSFEPLSGENLEEGIKLLYEIFPDDAQKAELAYRASIDPKSSYWKTRRILDYYLVMDKEVEKIVAITGFYQLDSHSEEEIWLGWYGVSVEFRGRGIGRNVLEWTINKAKGLGFKKFRLWTTDSPEEAIAQKLYESLGIKIYDKKQELDKSYITYYREIIF